jgi:integrase
MARHIKVTKTGFRAAVPLPAGRVRTAAQALRLGGNGSGPGSQKAQRRKERCVPYDLRHAYAIRARETTSWSYADVAAVMGHSPEVHRRTYLSEITGEQTKAAVVRRLLGDSNAA